MTEHEKDMFFRMLGVTELPDKLVRLYEQTKFLSDRVMSMPFPPSTLALIAVMAGMDGKQAAVQIPRDKLTKGMPISTYFEGKPVTGIYLGTCGSKNKGFVRVKIDGDNENFREIEETEIKLKE